MHFIKELTDLVFLEDQPEKSDIIFIPGGPYGAIAKTAADLYRKGFAPLLLPSGRYSKLIGHFAGPADSYTAAGSCAPVDSYTAAGSYASTDSYATAASCAPADLNMSPPAYATEWDYLRAILINEGVPSSAILKENQATYTYENAIYSRQVTDAAGLNIKKAILCCQAYHARRCRLYYEILYPDTQFFICPTVTRGISRDNWFLDEEKSDIVLGEIERWGAQFHDILRQYGPKVSFMKSSGNTDRR